VKKRYDCSKCPGYCCSYPSIEIDDKDLKRIADYFGLSKKEVRKRYTEKGRKPENGGGRPRILSHQDDEIFGTICIFFDSEARQCGAYEARPEICREYPGRDTCGYYEFLSFEREAQDDPDYIAVTGN
jgi:Fe-S-cluster containining protein